MLKEVKRQSNPVLNQDILPGLPSLGSQRRFLRIEKIKDYLLG